MMGEGGSISKGPDSAQNVSFKNSWWWPLYTSILLYSPTDAVPQ